MSVWRGQLRVEGSSDRPTVRHNTHARGDLIFALVWSNNGVNDFKADFYICRRQESRCDKRSFIKGKFQLDGDCST